MRSINTSPIYPIMTVPIVPTMNPLINLPAKKTGQVVAMNSTATAIKVKIKAPPRTNLLPNLSAKSPAMRDAIVALETRVKRALI